VALLNVSLPRHLYALVRREFLFDLQEGHGEVVPCVVFGAASQRNRTLSFHVLLQDGAQFARIPLHAIVHDAGAPLMPLGELALWDCFGDEFTVTEFDFLRAMEVTAFLPSGEQRGVYVCSFDWLNNGYSDAPDQHKTMHLIELENGCYALQPNNRLRWADLSFVKPFKVTPRYRTNTHAWYAEEAFEVKDPELFYYGVTRDSP